MDNKKIEVVNEEKKEIKVKSLVYSTEVTCPVCENTFKATVVKSSAYRVLKKDSDFFIWYSLINPYFYDVWVCNTCGYAAMKVDFKSLRTTELQQVQKLITPKWHPRIYPELYDVHIAIERYKLSLLNYVIINAKASKKAINCLKLAWMYRLLETENAKELELKYLSQALEELSAAYYAEEFPLYGMDKFSIIYLIGELNRRTGHPENSLVWFNMVITTPNVKQSLKELARDMKDLLKEEEVIGSKSEKSDVKNPSKESVDPAKKDKKTGFFSKLFK